MSHLGGTGRFHNIYKQLLRWLVLTFSVYCFHIIRGVGPFCSAFSALCAVGVTLSLRRRCEPGRFCDISYQLLRRLVFTVFIYCLSVVRGVGSSYSGFPGLCAVGEKLCPVLVRLAVSAISLSNYYDGFSYVIHLLLLCNARHGFGYVVFVSA